MSCVLWPSCYMLHLWTSQKAHNNKLTIALTCNDNLTTTGINLKYTHFMYTCHLCVCRSGNPQFTVYDNLFKIYMEELSSCSTSYCVKTRSTVCKPNLNFRHVVWTLGGSIAHLPKDACKAPANFPQVVPPFTVQGDFVKSIKTNSAWRLIQSFNLKQHWLICLR